MHNHVKSRQAQGFRTGFWHPGAGLNAEAGLGMMLSQEEKMEAVWVNRLSKEYMNALPIIRFKGEVVMITTAGQADEAVKGLMQEVCVGFDTESRPSFTKGTAYPISLVQFAAADKAYLFQMKKTGFTEGLKEFLEDSRIKKIGVGIKADIAKLQNLRPFNPNGFVDLSQLAAEKGIIQVGVRGLTARYLHHRLAKTAQKTNWARSELSEKQQVYAATDAWICLQVYPHLLADTLDYHPFRESLTESQPPETPGIQEEGQGKYHHPLDKGVPVKIRI